MKGIFGKLLLKITKKLVQVKKSYYWLIYDGTRKVISINPYNYLKSEQTRIDEKINFLIENIKYLCDHRGLHPVESRKENISQEIYNIK